MLLFQKDLSAVYWEDSLAALSELSTELKAREDSRKFILAQLGRVHVTNNLGPSRIQAAIYICPKLSITKMKMECDSFLTDVMLGTLVSLPMLDLKDVHIVGFENSLVTFENGIVPVLETIGRNLHTLKISNFELVDPLVVVASCPNLKTLKFHLNKSYTESETHDFLSAIENPKHLEKFYFSVTAPYDSITTHIPENQLSFFLGSPLLKHVGIYCCMTLTDSAIETAFRKSKFDKISTVDIAYCSTITNCGLEFFKQEENSISSFSIENCLLVDTHILETEWTAMAIQKNWNVKLNFLYEFKNLLADEDEMLIDE